jgi:hypothetical protein
MRGDFSRNPRPPGDPGPSLPLTTTPDALLATPYFGPLLEQGHALLDSYWNQHVLLSEERFRWLFDKVVQFPGKGSSDFSVTPDTSRVPTTLLTITGSHEIGPYLCPFASQGLSLTLPLYKFTPPLPKPDAALIYAEAAVQSTYPDGTNPDLTEPALAGRDGVVWLQPRFAVCDLPTVGSTGLPQNAEDTDKLFNPPKLKAKIPPGSPSTAAPDPCSDGTTPAPTTLENQLYRVEIHDPGVFPYGSDTTNPGRAASFKWSRDNASVRFACPPGTTLPPSTDNLSLPIKLINLTDDPETGLVAGQYVELIFAPGTGPDAPSNAWDQPPLPLLAVDEVDADNGQVTLTKPVGMALPQSPLTHVVRWDQNDKVDASSGAILIILDKDGKFAQVLENNLQVTFTFSVTSPPPVGTTVRPGDYWLIPTRDDRTKPLWSDADLNQPAGVPPHGPYRTRLPLALVDGNGVATSAFPVSSAAPVQDPNEPSPIFFNLKTDLPIGSRELTQVQPPAALPGILDPPDQNQLRTMSSLNISESLTPLQMLVIYDPSFDLFKAFPTSTWTDVLERVQRYFMNRETLAPMVLTLLKKRYLTDHGKTSIRTALLPGTPPSPPDPPPPVLFSQMLTRGQAASHIQPSVDLQLQPDPSTGATATPANLSQKAKDWLGAAGLDAVSVLGNMALSDFQNRRDNGTQTPNIPAFIPDAGNTTDKDSLVALWRSAQNVVALLMSAWPFDHMTLEDWTGASAAPAPAHS